VIQIVGGIKGINHSQFEDDTLLLDGVSLIIASSFKNILVSILDAYGGVINYIKC